MGTQKITKRWLGKFAQADEWIFCLTATKLDTSRNPLVTLTTG